MNGGGEEVVVEEECVVCEKRERSKGTSTCMYVYSCEGVKVLLKMLWCCMHTIVMYVCQCTYMYVYLLSSSKRILLCIL